MTALQLSSFAAVIVVPLVLHQVTSFQSRHNHPTRIISWPLGCPSCLLYVCGLNYFVQFSFLLF